MDVIKDVAPYVLMAIAAIYKWVLLNQDQRTEFIGIAGFIAIIAVIGFSLWQLALFGLSPEPITRLAVLGALLHFFNLIAYFVALLTFSEASRRRKRNKDAEAEPA
ncbi:hypothetical protein DN820_01860 [Stutzerimonas nosocomialis]|uniref:Uncharacterized protein n=1 Tax=Stutzerimonas nosocomialis TaxID=1056496 RepID=A0A5R9QJG9_9GAMM|nr:hypothetical protein [Stutzerimonas nosocomialis]TLX65083.1 hypothetical protein DN820_01860 [Stutzerimonas nosocomialis]